MKKPTTETIQFFSTLVLIIIIAILALSSCKKNYEPTTAEIKSIETVNLIQDNNLSASLPLPEYDYRVVQKVTYTNGLIAYRIPAIVDKTKHLVKFTEDNIKFVQAVSNDSTVALGIKLFSLKSTTGLLYYSMKIRTRDSYYAELKVVNELPLYTLSTGTFGSGGGEAEEAGKWFKCMRSRLSNCGGSWKCTLSCSFAILGTTGMCGLQMAASCYTW